MMSINRERHEAENGEKSDVGPYYRIRNMQGIKFAVILILSSAASGCAGQAGWGVNQTAGTAIAGGKTATAIDAVLDSLVGGRIGEQLGQRSRQQIFNAAQRAISTGRPQQWNDPGAGAHGSIVTSDPYRVNGQMCRNFSHVIDVNGKHKTINGEACRMADGRWHIVG